MGAALRARGIPVAHRHHHVIFSAAVVAVGLVLLVWGSDRFVMGASATARNLGVSPLVIGLTVVGIGTSAPEILVSATAAAGGNPGIAIGNAIGSNIANVGLVAGCTALVAPIVVRSETLRREFPLMFSVVGLAWLVLADGVLGRGDGAALMVGCVALFVAMGWLARRARRSDPMHDEFAAEIPEGLGTGRALGWVAIGLATLLVGSKAVVWGASSIATALGVSDLVIGLTIVAVGTSLPELAASIASARKGEHDIAVGNVLGSNMFNLLPVLSLPGLIAPGALAPEVMQRDFPAMVVACIALFVVAGFFGSRTVSGDSIPISSRNRDTVPGDPPPDDPTMSCGVVQRWEGAVLIAAFGGYQALLYYTTPH